MIPVGQPYRATGPIEIQPVLITIILGIVTGIFGAGLVWLWESSPIPTLMILTPIIQGIIVGSAFGFMVGRLQMRNPRLVGTIAFACGLLSIGLVHFGHHLQLTTEIASQMRHDVESDPELPAQQKQRILKQLDTAPEAAADRFLVMRTGSSGLLGSMKFRNEIGVHLKRTLVTGTVLWGLWAVEALIVATTAWGLAAKAAGKPYCEDCGYWCLHQPDVLVLPVDQGQLLLSALREDNSELARSAIDQSSTDEGTGHVGVSLHACPNCDLCFADVSQRAPHGKSEMKVTQLAQLLRISPEMVGTLTNPRTDAAHATAEPEPPQEEATLQPEA